MGKQNKVYLFSTWAPILITAGMSAWKSLIESLKVVQITHRQLHTRILWATHVYKIRIKTEMAITEEWYIEWYKLSRISSLSSTKISHFNTIPALSEVRSNILSISNLFYNFTLFFPKSGKQNVCLKLLKPGFLWWLSCFSST